MHGDLARSILTLMSPRFVLTVRICVPERGCPVAGGVPTSLTGGAGDMLGSGHGVHTQLGSVADEDGAAPACPCPSSPPLVNSQTVPTMSSRTATPAETEIWI